MAFNEPCTEPLPALLTTAEVAQVLQTVPNNVRQLAKNGLIPVAAVVGRGQRLFDRVEVERVAAARALKRSGV